MSTGARVAKRPPPSAAAPFFATLTAVLRRVTKIVEMFGVNSVPVLGVFTADWSPATALSVYWVENLIATVLVSARLYLHRRWTAAPGPDGTPPPLAKAPGQFFGTALVFTLAHGAMLALFLGLVFQLAPDLGNLRQAILALLAVQGLAFGVDLWTLERWPARRVDERADHLMGRVVLVHLSIIAGVVLAAWLDRPAAFFAFFVGCKVLSDVTQFLPRVDTAPGSAPPRWLSAVMRRFPKKNGLTFEEHWARTNAGPPAAAPPRAAAPRRTFRTRRG